MELKKYRLSEIIETFIPGDWGEESFSSESPNAVRCVRGADIVPIWNSDYDHIPVRYISNRSFANKQLKVGDIIIEKSGGSPTQSTGRTAFVSKELISNASHLVCTNFCTAFRIKPGWNPQYVYYYLQHLYNNDVFFNFEGKTSGLKNLQIENAFDKATITQIPIEKQNQIVEVLDTLDRKIALNRAINRNLESLAKQLYDYWFVQFDFPNENGRPYKSSGGKMVWNEVLKRDVPEGWEVKRIGEVLGRVKSTPRLVTDEYLNEGKYPIIDQTRTIYYAGFTNREDAVLNQFPAVVFGDHSCAVKYVNFPFARGADGTQILIPNDERVTSEYLYFVVQNVKLKEGYARHFSLLKDSAFVLPSIAISKMYAEIVVPYFEQIKHNRHEIITLTHQRDELLPLLMNGQVEVRS